MARIFEIVDAGQARLDGRVDLFAAAVSVLCLVHCLLLPLVLTLMPVVGVLSGDPWVHRALVLIAVPATLWAVWNTPLRKGGCLFVIPALSGLLLLLLAAFVAPLWPIEETLTVTGALILAAAHIGRRQRHRSLLRARRGAARSICSAGE